MLEGPKIKENLERWLTQGNYNFKLTPNKTSNFHLLIKHAGSFGTPIEIFQPKSQPSVTVCGAKVVMKNNQISRYLKLNPKERKNFEDKVASFCESIKTIHRFLDEDGKKKVGVYVVFDDKYELNHDSFFKTLDNVSEMHEKTAHFILKTF